MEIVKIIAVAVLTCVLVTLVSQHKPEFALLLQLVAVAVMLSMSADSLMDILSKAKTLAGGLKINSQYILLLMKALIISISCRVACDICADSGNRAVAQCVDLAGRLTLLLLSFPLLTALSQLAINLIKE